MKRYVRCRVSPGLFNTEFYVSIPNSSAYVSSQNVKVRQQPEPGRDVEGEVVAYMIDEGHGRDEVLIELTGEPVVGGLRTWIPKRLLVGA